MTATKSINKIRLEIFLGGGDDNQVLKLEINEIPYTNMDDSISEDKIGYDTWEFISYATDEYQTIKKLLSFRRDNLFDYILTSYKVGENLLTDKYIKLLLSSEIQDTYPELYI